MKKINIFHIGFFHSASTLLQTEIFPRIPGFDYINENKQLTASSVSLMPKSFGTNYAYENKKIFKLIKNNSNKNSIFSSEAFTYFVEHPSFYKTGHLEDTGIAINNLATYLSKNDDRVLFIIRKQTDVIESYYRRWRHLTKNPNDIFIDYPYLKNRHNSRRTQKLSNYGMMYLRSFNYRQILSPILNLIDLKRIHIIPYEYLIKDKIKFLDLLGKAFSKDLKPLAHLLRKRYNQSDMYKHNLPNNFKKKLQKEFDYDNQKIDEVLKLNLKKLGYY